MAIKKEWPTKGRSWEENQPKVIDPYKQKCMHEACPSCHGTGRKADGSACIHMLVCHCPKCSVRC